MSPAPMMTKVGTDCWQTVDDLRIDLGQNTARRHSKFLTRTLKAHGHFGGPAERFVAFLQNRFGTTVHAFVPFGADAPLRYPGPQPCKMSPRRFRMQDIKTQDMKPPRECPR